MRILKRERVGVVAKFMGRVRDMPDNRRKELKAAAKEAQEGNKGPLIDLLKQLIGDKDMLAALLKLLPVLLPLLLLLL